MVLDGPVFGFAAATAVGRVVVVAFSSDDGLVSASVFVAVTGRENCRPVMDPGLTNASDVKAKSSAWSRQRRIAAAEFFTVTALDRIFIEVKLSETDRAFTAWANWRSAGGPISRFGCQARSER